MLQVVLFFLSNISCMRWLVKIITYVINGIFTPQILLVAINAWHFVFGPNFAFHPAFLKIDCKDYYKQSWQFAWFSCVGEDLWISGIYSIGFHGYTKITPLLVRKASSSHTYVSQAFVGCEYHGRCQKNAAPKNTSSMLRNSLADD